MDGRLLLRVSEAADLLGIGKSTAYELIAAGEIPAIRLGKGKAIRVSVGDLQDWVSLRRTRKEGKNGDER